MVHTLNFQKLEYSCLFYLVLQFLHMFTILSEFLKLIGYLMLFSYSDMFPHFWKAIFQYLSAVDTRVSDADLDKDLKRLQNLRRYAKWCNICKKEEWERGKLMKIGL